MSEEKDAQIRTLFTKLTELLMEPETLPGVVGSLGHVTSWSSLMVSTFCRMLYGDQQKAFKAVDLITEELNKSAKRNFIVVSGMVKKEKPENAN